jgi:hypothetical protein
MEEEISNRCGSSSVSIVRYASLLILLNITPNKDLLKSGRNAETGYTTTSRFSDKICLPFPDIMFQGQISKNWKRRW